MLTLRIDLTIFIPLFMKLLKSIFLILMGKRTVDGCYIIMLKNVKNNGSTKLKLTR